jgi:hypothetical protein
MAGQGPLPDRRGDDPSVTSPLFRRHLFSKSSSAAFTVCLPAGQAATPAMIEDQDTRVWGSGKEKDRSRLAPRVW